MTETKGGKAREIHHELAMKMEEGAMSQGTRWWRDQDGRVEDPELTSRHDTPKLPHREQVPL